MALAKYKTGSSDVLADGSRLSFVYAQDKLSSLKLIMNRIIDFSHLGLLLISSHKFKAWLLLRSRSLGKPCTACQTIVQLGQI